MTKNKTLIEPMTWLGVLIVGIVILFAGSSVVSDILHLSQNGGFIYKDVVGVIKNVEGSLYYIDYVVDSQEYHGIRNYYKNSLEGDSLINTFITISYNKNNPQEFIFPSESVSISSLVRNGIVTIFGIAVLVWFFKGINDLHSDVTEKQVVLCGYSSGRLIYKNKDIVENKAELYCSAPRYYKDDFNELKINGLLEAILLISNKNNKVWSIQVPKIAEVKHK